MTLLPSGVDRVSEGTPIVAPTGALVGLGILSLFALLSEGAIADWSTVYLRVGLGTEEGFAAAGYCGFLIGPPLIGFVAQSSTLGLGLGVVVIVSVMIAVLGRVMGEPLPRPPL